MMKTSLCILPALALAALAGGGCASSGGFGPAPETLLRSGSWPGRAASASLQPATGKVAGLVSPKAKVGTLTLAGERIPVALDAAKADGELDQLRLDLAGKGDFTAATVMKMTPPPARQTTRMVDGKAEKVTLAPPPGYYNCEGFIPGPSGRIFAKGVVYNVTGTSSDGTKREFTNLSLRTASIRVGKASIAGVERAVALVDGNGNGLYNEGYDPQKPATLGLQYGGGDAVMIDFGKGDFADMKQVKSVQLDRYLVLEGKVYELTVDPQGQGMKVDLAVGGQGKISFDAGTMKVGASLLGRRLDTTVSSGEPASIPVGVYQVSLLQVQDPASKAMLLLRGGKPVEVVAGTPVAIPVETKLKCKISAAPMSADRQIRLSAVRTSSAGLAVAGVYGKDGKPTPVSFEVLGADGKQVAAGNFEFG
jgi:hypothetical protein